MLSVACGTQGLVSIAWYRSMEQGVVVVKIVARPAKGERLSHCKTWRLTWELAPTYDDEGHKHRHQETETFHGTKREAETRWAEREAEIQKAGPGYGPTQQSFQEAAEAWIKAHLVPPLSPHTIQDHAYVMRHYVVPRIGHLRLTDIYPDHLSTLYDDLRGSGGADGAPLSPRTVRLAHTLVHQVLQMSVDADRLPRNAADKARVPKQGQKRPPRWFSPQDMWQLVRAAEDHRLAAWVPLHWATGARPEELLGLRWENVDFAHRTLTFLWGVKEVHGHLEIGDLKRPKSRRTLAFPAGELTAGLDVFAYLDEHRKRQDEDKRRVGSATYQDHGWVFATELGLPLRWSNMRRWWKDLRTKAGVPPYPPYSVRHTCASHMLQAGVPLHVVSDWLGHGGVQITKDVYGHLDVETIRSAAGTMAVFVSSADRGAAAAKEGA